MDVDVSLLEPVLEQYEKGDASALIHALQDLQATYNYLPPEGVKAISDHLEVPMAKAYAAATFYKAFSLKPQGRTLIQVCKGTACHVRGAQLLEEELCRTLDIEVDGTTEDEEYTVKTVNCVGACAMAPLVIIGDKYHGRAQAAELRKMLDADGSSTSAEEEGSGDE